MDVNIKQQSVRAAAGILVFLVFLFVSVELQIRRLEPQVVSACAVAGFDCVQARINLARWQSPLNSSPWQAAQQALSDIGEGPFTAKEKQELLWELRTSVFGSRSILRSESLGNKSALLEAIDARLLPEDQITLKKKGSLDPAYLFQGGAQLFFFTWIGFVLLAIWRGMNAQGKVHWRIFGRFFGGAVFAFCSWLVCLSLA